MYLPSYIGDAYEDGGLVRVQAANVLSASHAVADVLKLYFKMLSEPLIPFSYYTTFMEIDLSQDRTSTVTAIQTLLSYLDRAHHDCLNYLLHFLAAVTRRSTHNLMTVKNLAIVWAPNILRPKPVENLVGTAPPVDFMTVKQEIENSQALIGFLISEVGSLFSTPLVLVDEEEPLHPPPGWVDTNPRHKILEFSSLPDSVIQSKTRRVKTRLSRHQRTALKAQNYIKVIYFIYMHVIVSKSLNHLGSFNLLLHKIYILFIL